MQLLIGSSNDGVAPIVGELRATTLGAFPYHLADDIVFPRHLEIRGELRKAIGVLKNRTADFERTLREFAITQHDIEVGNPMTGMRDILSGTPEPIEENSHSS